MDKITYAKIGQYAENEYWNKASGLLDQMASAIGGLISIDFQNPVKPVIEKIEFDYVKQALDFALLEDFDHLYRYTKSPAKQA